jgi:hypothetical protein
MENIGAAAGPSARPYGHFEDFSMGRLAVVRRMMVRSRPGVLAMAIVLASAPALLGQDARKPGGDQADAAGPYPRLPGAVTTAPDWIGPDAPFDAASYFVTVARDENAAPLYLDAFFEFGTEMVNCFPAGPERDRRQQAAAVRMKKYMELDKAIQETPETVSPAAIDAVIALYDSGFRKLAEAQRRGRCAFETGLGVDALLPHAQTARQVVRVASLRVRRDVERGDYDAAIGEVALSLRLVRDLRARGFMITQLVAVAITHVICNNMVNPIIAGPGLRIEQCDRLLRMLLDHEASSPDGYVDGLRTEYLLARYELRKMDLTQSNGRPRGSPDDLAGAVRRLNDYYRAMLGLEHMPFAERLKKIKSLKIPRGDDVYSRMLNELDPAVESLTAAIGRMNAIVRASECMLVMRRWQLNHRGLPRTLVLAVKEAGLKGIPIDPYDGKPMRVALLGSPRVVYSVGRDGRDDEGQKDSKFDTVPGDLLYRMPEVEQPRR